MKVVLDTNVIVSAVTTRGLCADVFRAVLAEHELVTCPKILQEVRRTLQSKFAVPESLIAEYLELIQDAAFLVGAGEMPEIRIKDKDDIEIIAAAIAGKAEALVTGDREEQELNRVKKLQILSPRAFWEELTGRAGGYGKAHEQR